MLAVITAAIAGIGAWVIFFGIVFFVVQMLTEKDGE